MISGDPISGAPLSAVGTSEVTPTEDVTLDKWAPFFVPTPRGRQLARAQVAPGWSIEQALTPETVFVPAYYAMEWPPRPRTARHPLAPRVPPGWAVEPGFAGEVIATGALGAASLPPWRPRQGSPVLTGALQDEERPPAEDPVLQLGNVPWHVELARPAPRAGEHRPRHHFPWSAQAPSEEFALEAVTADRWAVEASLVGRARRQLLREPPWKDPGGLTLDEADRVERVVLDYLRTQGPQPARRSLPSALLVELERVLDPSTFGHAAITVLVRRILSAGFWRARQ